METKISNGEVGELVGGKMAYRGDHQRLVKWIKIALCAQLVVVAGYVLFVYYEDKNMDRWECILKYVGDARSDKSAGMVARACNEVYGY